MAHLKSRIIQMIQRMPDECTIDDIMEELYFMDRVERGLAELDAGKIIFHRKVKRRLKKWLN